MAHDGEVATRLGLPAVPAAAETIALMTISGTRARDGRSRPSVPFVDGRQRGDGAGREERGTCRSPAMSVHITCTCAKSISAGSTRTRTWCRHCVPFAIAQRCAPEWSTARSISFVPITRQSTTTASRCLSARPSPEPPDWNYFCRLRSNGLPRIKWHCPRRWRKSPPNLQSCLESKRETSPPGRAADICVFDPAQFWMVERRALKSQGKNTPFLGLEVPGKVRFTLVGGQVVYEA